MKVALVQCPLWGTYDPPLAIAQLSSYLKERGHQVFALDLNIKLYLNRSPEHKYIWAWEQSDFWYNPEYVKKFFFDKSSEVNCYLEQILNNDIRIVGFSVNTASRLASIEFAKRLKEHNNKIMIVFGGSLFLNNDFIREVLNEEVVDIVIPNEGEIAFCELIDSFEKGKDISDTHGIAFKEDGHIERTKPTELINLDSLPFLDFSNLLLKDYDDSEHIPFMASRGCVKKCVFCSDAPCWPGYRAMTGERIFKEVSFYKNKYKDSLGHVDFMDLVFNGNMASLEKFCDLMIEANLNIYWTANMIVRPEMNKDIIDKLARAKCEHIIFGIESGSLNVLQLMNKHYRIEDADRIVRHVHDAGICVTCNFMFGFPGEREEDFQLTLEFIKRNAPYIDRVYPSRTYCALEEFSYLCSHLEEFGIKPNPPNHLYWESIDGLNTYPVRLDRCRRFCKLASSLGIEVGAGVQTSVELDEWYNLGHYYESREDKTKAIECFLNYHQLDSKSEIINNKLITYYGLLKRDNLEVPIDENISVQLQQVVSNISKNNVSGSKVSEKLGRGHSMALVRSQLREFAKSIEGEKTGRAEVDRIRLLENRFLSSVVRLNDSEREEILKEFCMFKQRYIHIFKELQKRNSNLNDEEFNSRKAGLESCPKSIFLQFSGPCNSNCVFCSRGSNYEYFDLVTFQERIEKEIPHVLEMAERFIFTGSGEFLLLPQKTQILEYFDTKYPHIEKMFSTNGSALLPQVSEMLAHGRSKYTIHISLHASNSWLHKVLTRTDNFELILNNIKYILELRKKTKNPTINFIFVATILNIEDLPNFVRLAGDLGADKVICYYNYIYIPTQKYLSCFFKQTLTNRMLDEAREIGQKLNIEIQLPPRFGLKEYSDLGICREPWSQIMINSQGHILPCDASEDCDLSLGNKSFDEIWNSKYYLMLRQAFINEKLSSCFSHCHRANPSSVNIFPSHVIHRGRKDAEINELWGDNF